MSSTRAQPVGSEFLSRGRILIGMVHVGATPGTPFASAGVDQLAEQAAEEARILREAGFDAIIVENMHDAPYVHGEALGPEQTATMTRVTLAVAGEFKGPMGVQILSGGNTQALAVASATGAGFIRCENFVFSHVADEGVLERAEAGPLLRYRRHIGAEHIAIAADIKKKHASHAITADVSIGETAEAAQFFGVDALIVTGPSTGKPADLDDLKHVRRVATVPVLVGSGVTPESVAPLFDFAEALIVGSSIKEQGSWKNPVDPARAEAIVRARDRA